ncbi:MAG: AbrB/MazE/SpoVT family DNA-binding domain-containing protein [Armatimonadota bacterium]
MATVKVSSKYQIVIPREVRRVLGIQKGQTVSVIPVGGVIEVVPHRELATLEGAYPEISLSDVRDESDRALRSSDPHSLRGRRSRQQGLAVREGRSTRRRRSRST